MQGFLKSNKGIAMPIIVMVVAILFIIASTVLTLNENLTRNVSYTVGRENALQIAEAGYNRYLYYLNQDSEFYRNKQGIHIAGAGAEELGFVPETTDSNGLPLDYKVTTYKNGQVVIGYYQIKIKQPTAGEDLTVKCTGWTARQPDIKRTIQVRIHKKSFAEFVDFSASSGNVNWTTGDVANGPVFCNSDINIRGNPVFNDDVMTHGRIIVYSGSPTYNGGKYENVPSLAFPVTNTEIKNWGTSSKGIYLTGRTCILLSDDKLLIRNKNKNGDARYEENIPESGVVFVEGGDVFVSGTLDGRLTIYATENIYITGKDPTEFNASSATKTGGIFYKDTNTPGKGATGSNYTDDMLGLISEKNIIIATLTWPSSSTSSGTRTYDRYSYVATSNLTVYGALMAKSSGMKIYVENYYDVYPLGNLTVVGSKIQNGERGAVGTFNPWTYQIVSGYNKTDRFDYRLKTQSPPHFIEPVNAGWEIKSWEELPSSN